MTPIQIVLAVLTSGNIALVIKLIFESGRLVQKVEDLRADVADLKGNMARFESRYNAPTGWGRP